MPDSVDVLVLGAGPAGATAARLLKGWGYSVLLLEGPRQRHTVVETLPSTIDSILETTGLRDEVSTAGFWANSGTTAWWESPDPQSESRTLPGGYHVDRHHFDSLLLELARREGVAIAGNTRAPRFDLMAGTVDHDHGTTKARFLLDATGRPGLLARQIRRFWDERYGTIALCGMVRAVSPWDVDPHHALIEAYESGWGFSSPLAPDRRHLCFMVEASAVRSGVENAFDLALRGTIHFRRLFGDSELENAPWSRDATLYYAEHYAGPNWLLIGDAASFVDPISGSGVEKALRSAWHAAVVVNTCLSQPALQSAALEFFETRERQTYADRARDSWQRFSMVADRFGGEFWKPRAQPPEGNVEAVTTRLRDCAPVRLEIARRPVFHTKPEIEGNEVVLVNRAILPGLENVQSVRGIDLATVATMAPGFTDLRRFYNAYEARRPGVQWTDFLAALSFLIENEIIRVQPH